MNKCTKMWLPGRTRNNSHISRKGFTLVELIVVLVILAILAAVVVPLMIGFTSDSQEKKYVEEAKSALAAAETMLSDAYTNNLVYIPKRMRDQALVTSGLDSNTELTIFTVKSFRDADGTANTISSYTIAEALYKAKDGTYVYYDGSDWKIIEANDPIISGAKDRDTYIKVWKADMTDTAGNSIHGSSGDPQGEEPDIVVIDKEDRDDEHGEEIDEKEPGKTEIHTTLVFNLLGEAGKVTFPDGGYEFQATYDVEQGEFDVNVESDGWIDRWYDASTLKWVCDALTEDEQKKDLDYIAMILAQNVTAGTTTSYTLTAAVEEKKVTIPVTFAAKSSKLSVSVQDEPDKQVELVYGLKTQSILTSFDMNTVSAISNVTVPEADKGAITFSGSWVVKRASAYVMQGDDYKLVSSNAIKDDVKNWAKATVTDPTSATQLDALKAGVTYEALADTNKTLHVRGTLTSDNKPDEKVRFIPNGASEKVEYSFDLSYAQTELIGAVCEVSAQGTKGSPLDLSDAGQYSIFTSAGLQVDYQPLKLRFWNIYDSHKNGELIGDTPRLQLRDEDCSKELVKQLYSTGYYGEVAEIEVTLATTKFLVTESGTTDLTSMITGLVSGGASAIREIRYIEHDQRASKNEIRNEVCLSTTTIAKTGHYLQRDGKGEYVIESYDSEYPAYTVAYTLKKEEGVVYVVTEGDTAIKAEKSLKGFFEGFTQMEENSLMEHVDTSEVTDMSCMFKNCSNLTTSISLRIDDAVDISEMFMDAGSVSHIELKAEEENNALSNISNLFTGADDLSYVALTNINSEYISSLNGLFSGKTSLSEVDLSGFHTERILDFSGMFQGCSALNKVSGPYSSIGAAASKEATEIYVDISNAENISNMFKDASQLTGIYLNAVTKNEALGDVSDVFNGANGLTKAALTNVDSSGLTDLSNLFSGKTNLTEVDLTDLHTEYATTFSGMFQGCSSLNKVAGPYSTIPAAATKADAEIYVDISSATDISNMFKDASQLTGIYLNAVTKNEVLGNVSDVFNGASGLTKAALTNVDSSDLTDLSYLFSEKTNLTEVDLTDLHTEYATTFSGMFQGCSSLNKVAGPYSTIPAAATKADAEIYVDISNAKNISNMFKDASQLTGVYLNAGTQNKTLDNLEALFSGANALVHVAITNVDSESVTSLANLFSGKTALVDVDLTDFCLDHVTSMACLFKDCTSLQSVTSSATTLDGEGKPDYDVAIRIAAATDISQMFDYCSAVKSISLSGKGKEDSTGLSNINQVFKDCDALEKVEFKDLMTTELTGYASIFQNKRNLESVAFTRVDFPSITTMENLFSGCVALKNVNYDDFDTSNVTNMSYMFFDCRSLERVNLSEFKTENVTTMRAMFGNSTIAGLPDPSLEVLDISSFKTDSLTSIREMFIRCTALKTIYVDPTQWRSDKFEHDSTDSAGGNVFYGCANLKGLYGTNPVDETGEAYPTKHPEVSSEYAVADEDGTDLNNHNDGNDKGYFSAKIGTAMFCEMSCNKGPNSYTDGSTLDNWPEVIFKDHNKRIDLMTKFTRCTDPTMTEERAAEIGEDLTDDTYEDKVTNKQYKVYGWFEGTVFYWWSEAGTVYINPNTWGMFNFYYQKGANNKATALTEVDFQGIDTSKVISFGRFFSDAAKLPHIIDGSKGGADYRFKTSSAQYLNQMFAGCFSLESVNLRGFDTTGVTHMNQMFLDTASLESIDLSDFSSDMLTTVQEMFYMREGKTYNGVKYNVNQVNKLNSVIFGEHFTCEKVTNMYRMFRGCQKLKTLDLSNFNSHKTAQFSSGLDVREMFYDCQGLQTIIVTDPDIAEGNGFYSSFSGSYQSRINNSGNMFEKCPALRGGSGDSVSSLGNIKDATYAHVGRTAHDGLAEQHGLFTAVGSE